MVRFALVVLALFVTEANAQAPVDPLGPGSRVRIYYSPEALPPSGAVFSGTLVSLGDTLVMDTDRGNRIRVSPTDLSGFDVSAGRPPFPYWLPVATAAAGGAAGYGISQTIPSDGCTFQPACPNSLATSTGRVRIIVGTGLVVGAIVGAYVGTRLSAERWVPGSRLSVRGGGVTLSLAL